jgi:NAD+ synthase (glutamine-hydrolysing)
MPTFRLAMAQINVTVGDLEGNTGKIIEYINRARSLKADLVAFPELAVTGYPPEDLVFKPQFVRDNLTHLSHVVEASKGISVVVGFVDGDPDDPGPGGKIHNAAAVAFDGRLAGVYHKILLPNYGVFDEVRYFEPGGECPVFDIKGTPVGVSVCEDIWYPAGPTSKQAAAGARVIVNINGSPFHAGKRGQREEMLASRAVDNELFVTYVNLVGGQDELVFDGGSMVLSPSGQLVAQGSQFEEELIVADLEVEARSATGPTGDGRPPIPQRTPTTYGPTGEIYAALVTGTRDYVRKCGFERVLIALSGGIDSSLVAAIAVDALGGDNVVGISMPSRFSSEGSRLDAATLAESLGMELRTISIEGPFTASMDTLSVQFEGMPWDVAEENLQSRIRANLIMALSNKFGWLVLTTGNKSEIATGYTTIYGDMAGGFAVINDVPKTMVYELVAYRNGLGPSPVIPRSVLEKPPSAELRPNQTDQDSLPPYSTLDPIIKAYVEEDRDFDQIVKMGFDEELVRRVIGLVDRSEYKRRQAPPGIKITPRNFGRDRRMPIASRYRPY